MAVTKSFLREGVHRPHHHARPSSTSSRFIHIDFTLTSPQVITTFAIPIGIYNLLKYASLSLLPTLAHPLCTATCPAPATTSCALSSGSPGLPSARSSAPSPSSGTSLSP